LITPDSTSSIEVSAQIYLGISGHSFRQACKHFRRQGLRDFTKGHPIASMASDLMAPMVPPASLTSLPQGNRHLFGRRLAHFSHSDIIPRALGKCKPPSPNCQGPVKVGIASLRAQRSNLFVAPRGRLLRRIPSPPLTAFRPVKGCFSEAPSRLTSRNGGRDGASSQ